MCHAPCVGPREWPAVHGVISRPFLGPGGVPSRSSATGVLDSVRQ